MNVGYKESELFGKDEQGTGDVMHSSSSGGTFALRRDRYLNEVGNQQPYADQLQLLELYRTGNDFAKRKLCAVNMQMVIDVVKCNANRGVTFLDLILAGNQGLNQALDKFVQEEGISFPVFAEQCVRETIEHAIMDKGSVASHALNASYAVDSPTPCNFVIKPLNE